MDIIKLPPALLYTHGGDLIRTVRSLGYKVFADVKLCDIPATVARGVGALTDAGADFITIHLSGGEEMVRAAVDAAHGRSTILGVAILTSLSTEDQERLFRRSGMDLLLDRYALGASAGLNGFVCPPWALSSVREKYPRSDAGAKPNFCLAVPGLRWEAQPDDHAQTMTPEDAIRAGADILILGRTLMRALREPDGINRLVALRSL